MEQMTLLDMPKSKNPTSGCKGTIATIAIAELQKSGNAKLALAAVKAAFPEAKTTMKCIYWYASKMKIRLQKTEVDRENEKILEQAQALFRLPVLVKKAS